MKEKPEFVHAFSHLSKARDLEVSCSIHVHYRLESYVATAPQGTAVSNCRHTQEAISEMIEGRRLISRIGKVGRSGPHWGLETAIPWKKLRKETGKIVCLADED